MFRLATLRPLPASAAKAAGAVAVWMTLGGTDQFTWYAYCDGSAGGRNFAVMSENFWPHPHSLDHGRDVGRSAEEYFEKNYGMPLAGCSGWPSGTRCWQSKAVPGPSGCTLRWEMVYLFHLPDSIVARPLSQTAEPKLSARAPLETGPSPEERTTDSRSWRRAMARD